MLNRQLQFVILVDFRTTTQTLQLDVFVYTHDLIFLSYTTYGERILYFVFRVRLHMDCGSYGRRTRVKRSDNYHQCLLCGCIYILM